MLVELGFRLLFGMFGLLSYVSGSTGDRDLWDIRWYRLAKLFKYIFY